MNCPKCNYENPDNALFCANCGAKLETPSPYAPADAPAAADPSAQLPVYGAGAAQQSSPEPSASGTASQQSAQQSFPTYNQQPAAQSFPTYNQQPAAGGYSAQYNPQGYYNNYNYNAPRPGQERDWAAITALVCGIFSLPCCMTVFGGVVVSVCAIIFGIIGIKSSKKAMAIVGLCLGAVGLLCAIIMVIAVFSMPSSPSDLNDFLYEFENAMQI